MSDKSCAIIGVPDKAGSILAMLARLGVNKCRALSSEVSESKLVAACAEDPYLELIVICCSDFMDSGVSLIRNLRKAVPGRVRIHAIIETTNTRSGGHILKGIGVNEIDATIALDPKKVAEKVKGRWFPNLPIPRQGPTQTASSNRGAPVAPRAPSADASALAGAFAGMHRTPSALVAEAEESEHSDTGTATEAVPPVQTEAASELMGVSKDAPVVLATDELDDAGFVFDLLETLSAQSQSIFGLFLKAPEDMLAGHSTPEQREGVCVHLEQLADLVQQVVNRIRGVA